jgi:hypothetical protein
MHNSAQEVHIYGVVINTTTVSKWQARIVKMILTKRHHYVRERILGTHKNTTNTGSVKHIKVAGMFYSKIKYME